MVPWNSGKKILQLLPHHLGGLEPWTRGELGWGFWRLWGFQVKEGTHRKGTAQSNPDHFLPPMIMAG